MHHPVSHEAATCSRWCPARRELLVHKPEDRQVMAKLPSLDGSRSGCRATYGVGQLRCSKAG